MADYPTFTGGMVAQLPFLRIMRFETLVVDLPGGTRRTARNRETPPSAWEISYSALTDDEAEDLRDFFLARGGRYENFTFTDPEDASVHTNCWFGMEDLSIRRAGRNQNAAQVLIVEYP